MLGLTIIGLIFAGLMYFLAMTAKTAAVICMILLVGLLFK